jgi:hypothetical protein
MTYTLGITSTRAEILAKELSEKQFKIIGKDEDLNISKVEITINDEIDLLLFFHAAIEVGFTPYRKG